MCRINIHVLNSGVVIVDSELAFSTGESHNPLAFTGLFRSKVHEITLPVSAYLIEHPKRLVLVDTGCHTDVRNHMFSYLGPFLYLANKAYLPEGEAINEQLQKLGYKTSDIDKVVLTHLDCDHVSGLKLVADAKSIMVNNLEYDGAMGNPVRYKKSMWEGVPLKLFEYRASNEGIAHRSYDLYGDGVIQLVYTPGHSKGMCTVKITNNNKFILLTADCGYGSKSWNDLILPGLNYDKEEMLEALNWVQLQSEDSNCVAVIANHDATIKPHVISL